MEDKSKLTAIHRNGLSAPIKRLSEELKDMSPDSVLHHGRGKAYNDANFLESIARTNYQEFDPNVFFISSRFVLCYKYDLVVSNFVMNVLIGEDRHEAWIDVMQCVKDSGVAYISVRSNKDSSIKGSPCGDGVITSKGTFQKGYSANDLYDEAMGYFKTVSVTSHGHYLTAVCEDPM